jgi:hypothetical protein
MDMPTSIKGRQFQTDPAVDQLPLSDAAELSERKIFNSDSDGLPLSAQTSGPVKQVINLTNDDDDGSESDDELPSVQRISASASPSSK